MKAIKKFILEKLSFKEPKDISKSNSLKTFIDNLSQEEKDGDFLKLDPVKQVGYVQAMVKFMIEAMGDVGEASMKSLVMFAFCLHKDNVDSFELSQKFYGTKENLSGENFSIKITKIEDINKVEKEKQIIEYGDESLKQPRKKFESFFNQTEIILEIIEQLEKTYPKKLGDELPRRVASILLMAEFMSECNMENTTAILEGLMDRDKPLNVSYKVQAVRKEQLLINETMPRKKINV